MKFLLGAVRVPYVERVKESIEIAWIVGSVVFVVRGEVEWYEGARVGLRAHARFLQAHVHTYLFFEGYKGYGVFNFVPLGSLCLDSLV